MTTMTKAQPTTDLKGLIDELRQLADDLPNKPVHLGQHLRLLRSTATALESILSRQPFEHEGEMWQMVPVIPRMSMDAAVAEKFGQRHPHLMPEFFRRVYTAQITAAAEEAKK